MEYRAYKINDEEVSFTFATAREAYDYIKELAIDEDEPIHNYGVEVIEK